MSLLEEISSKKPQIQLQQQIQEEPPKKEQVISKSIENEGGEYDDEDDDQQAFDTKGSFNVSHNDTGRRTTATSDNFATRNQIVSMKDPKYKMDAKMARFPLRIVWTPLPCITQVLPVIGHTGIGDSRGITHDFAGPYYVSIDDLAFGETHKYVTLDLEGISEQDYNEAIRKADKTYEKRMHNICCDNCHSHVARVLNNLKYKGRTNYTMIDVWWMCTTKSKFVEWKHVIFTYIVWIIVALWYLASYLF